MYHINWNFCGIIFHNNSTSLIPKPSGGKFGYETTISPVTPSHVVSDRWGTPPAVDNSDVFHWALIVQPAQKLGGLPVLDWVVGAGSIPWSISPDDLRLWCKVDGSLATESKVITYNVLSLSSLVPSLVPKWSGNETNTLLSPAMDTACELKLATESKDIMHNAP